MLRRAFRIPLTLALVLVFPAFLQAAFFFAPAKPVLYTTVPDANGVLWARDFETSTVFALGEAPKSLTPLESGDRPWFVQQTGNPRYLRTLTLASPLDAKTFTVKLGAPDSWLQAVRSGRYLYKSVGANHVTSLVEVDLVDPAQKSATLLKVFDPAKAWFSPDGAALIYLGKNELLHLDLATRKSVRIQKLSAEDTARLSRVEFIDPTGRGWLTHFTQPRPSPAKRIFGNLLGESLDLTHRYPPGSTQIGASDLFQVCYDGFRNRLVTFQRRNDNAVVISVLDPAGKLPAEEHTFTARLPASCEVHFMRGGGLLFVSDKNPTEDLRLAHFQVFDLVAREVREEYFLPTVARHSTGNTTYLGETFEGKRHGYGLFNWADGASYRGSWLADKMHGEGTWKKGDEVISGTWANGKAVLVEKTYAPAPNLRFEYSGPLDDQLRSHGRGVARVLIVDPKTKIVIPNGFFGTVEGWFEAGELRFGLALQHKILADFKTQQLPVYLGFFSRNQASQMGRVPTSSNKFSDWIQPYGQFQPGDVSKPFSRRANSEPPKNSEATLAATAYLDVIAELESRLLPLLEKTAKETALSDAVFQRQRREREAEQARLVEEARLASERAAQEALQREKEAAAFQEKIYAYDRNSSGRATNGAHVNLNSRQQLQYYRLGDFIAYNGRIVRIVSDPTYDGVALSDGEVLHGSIKVCSATVKAENFRFNCPECAGRGFVGTPTTQTIKSSSPYTRTYTSTLGTTWRETGTETTTTTVRSYASVRCSACSGSGRTQAERILHY